MNNPQISPDTKLSPNPDIIHLNINQLGAEELINSINTSLDRLNFYNQGPIDLDRIINLTNAKGIVFDVDNCLIYSENCQLAVWERSIEAWAIDIDRQCDSEGIEAIKNSIRNSFATGDMAGLIPDIYSTAESFGFAPCKINDLEIADKVVLENYLKEKRIPLLQECCENGEICLTPGTPELLTYLKEQGLKIGIFTSAPQEITEPILTKLLGQEGLSFDELAPAKHRVYGQDSELRRNKPDPQGWLLATERMGLFPEDIILADDRCNVLLGAKGCNFGALIGLAHGEKNLADWNSFGAQEDSDTVYIILENFTSCTY